MKSRNCAYAVDFRNACQTTILIIWITDEVMKVEKIDYAGIWED